MAGARGKAGKRRKTARPKAAPAGRVRGLRRWALRGVAAVLVAAELVIVGYRWIDPPVTIYTWQESRRLDGIPTSRWR